MAASAPRACLQPSPWSEVFASALDRLPQDDLPAKQALRKECKGSSSARWGFCLSSKTLEGPAPRGVAKEAALIDLGTAGRRRGVSSYAEDGAGPPARRGEGRECDDCVLIWPRSRARPSALEIPKRRDGIENSKSRRVKLRDSLPGRYSLGNQNFIPQARPAEARRGAEALRRAGEVAVRCWRRADGCETFRPRSREIR